MKPHQALYIQEICLAANIAAIIIAAARLNSLQFYSPFIFCVFIVLLMFSCCSVCFSFCTHLTLWCIYTLCSFVYCYVLHHTLGEMSQTLQATLYRGTTIKTSLELT